LREVYRGPLRPGRHFNRCLPRQAHAVEHRHPVGQPIIQFCPPIALVRSSMPNGSP
jgi:hypothetical protein